MLTGNTRINHEIFGRHFARRKKISLSEAAFALFLMFVTAIYSFHSLFSLKFQLMLVAISVAIFLIFYLTAQEFVLLLVFVAYILALLSLYLFHALWPFAVVWSILLLVFYSWGQSNYPLTVQYKPPGEVTPGEIAYMIEDRLADERELFVTLLDLDKKGLIELVPTPKDVYIRRYVDMGRLDNLNPLERFVLNRIFTMTGVRTILETGIPLSYSEFPTEVSLDYVLNNLNEWKKAFDMTFREYLTYYKPVYHPLFLPSGRKVMYYGLFTILWIIAIGYAIVGSTGKLFQLDYPFSMGLFGLSTMIFGWKYTGALTEFGKAAMAKIKGFGEFLRRVEWPRLRWMIKNGKISINDLFIYAIAFKLFDRIDFWIKKMRADSAIDSENIIKISKLWEVIRKRWWISRMMEQFTEGTGN